MKVLLGQGMARKYGDTIRKLGYEVIGYDEKNPNAVKDYGEDILIGAINLENLNYKDHKNLKYIFLTSVGIDFLDLKKLLLLKAPILVLQLMPFAPDM